MHKSIECVQADALKGVSVFSWQTVLTEIKEWMDAHPKEVVILSFSHFLGLSPELHVQLLATIRNIFTSKLCPKTVRLVLLFPMSRLPFIYCLLTVR